MAYFVFNKVTDPPNDETVDAITQLNDNWQDVNDKLIGFNQSPNDITGPPIGIEAFAPVPDQARIAAWDGAVWRLSINHSSIWGSWQAVTLRAPVVERTGFPVMARVDPIGRRVVFSGGVYFNAAQDAWPTGSDVEITDDTAIGVSLSPSTAGLSYYQAATSQVTTAGGFASANVRIQEVTGPDRVGLFVRFQGDAGGGNFVMLDGLTWWY